MRSVRIYKDDIRTHILRSLFFTDTALVLIGSLTIAALLYALFQYGLHFFSWSYYLSAVFVSIIFFVAFITQRIDNQPIFKIVPRATVFSTSKKQSRTHNLEPYFTNFDIQGNFIIRKDSLIQVFEVDPFDVALLNEQDREHFFVKMKQTIHTLPRQIQLIVRKERASSKDYSNHFFSLYDGASRKREKLIQQYIENVSEIIDSHDFLITRHYAILSVPCQPNRLESKQNAVRKLTDLSTTFAANLSVCHITLRPLVNEELASFVKKILR